MISAQDLFGLLRCRVGSRLVTIDERLCVTVQAISPIQEIGISHVCSAVFVIEPDRQQAIVIDCLYADRERETARDAPVCTFKNAPVYAFRTLPCVPSTRLCHITHGSVLNVHTALFSVQERNAHTQHSMIRSQHHTTPHNTQPHYTHHTLPLSLRREIKM